MLVYYTQKENKLFNHLNTHLNPQESKYLSHNLDYHQQQQRKLSEDCFCLTFYDNCGSQIAPQS